MQFVRAAVEKIEERRTILGELLNSGHPAIVVCLNEGILLMAENVNRRQNKIAKIYDRIAFIGCGKGTDFYAIMAALATNADIEGMNFSPGDVSVDDLKRITAQILSHSFHDIYSHPLKAQVVLAEISPDPAKDVIFKVDFEGTVYESTTYLVLGGKPNSEQKEQGMADRQQEINDFLKDFYRRDLTLNQTAKALLPLLNSDGNVRVEAVVLLRELVLAHRFNKVYQEFDLRQLRGEE